MPSAIYSKKTVLHNDNIYLLPRFYERVKINFINLSGHGNYPLQNWLWALPTLGQSVCDCVRSAVVFGRQLEECRLSFAGKKKLPEEGTGGGLLPAAGGELFILLFYLLESLVNGRGDILESGLILQLLECVHGILEVCPFDDLIADSDTNGAILCLS